MFWVILIEVSRWRYLNFLVKTFHIRGLVFQLFFYSTIQIVIFKLLFYFFFFFNVKKISLRTFSCFDFFLREKSGDLCYWNCSIARINFCWIEVNSSYSVRHLETLLLAKTFKFIARKVVCRYWALHSSLWFIYKQAPFVECVERYNQESDDCKQSSCQGPILLLLIRKHEGKWLTKLVHTQSFFLQWAARRAAFLLFCNRWRH